MMEVLDRELNNLKGKCDSGDWYGALLAVKDSYEILIKFSCLMICALSYQKNGDDSFFKLLTSPEHSMSLGDGQMIL